MSRNEIYLQVYCAALNALIQANTSSEQDGDGPWMRLNSMTPKGIAREAQHHADAAMVVMNEKLVAS